MLLVTVTAVIVVVTIHIVVVTIEIVTTAILVCWGYNNKTVCWGNKVFFSVLRTCFQGMHGQAMYTRCVRLHEGLRAKIPFRRALTKRTVSLDRGNEPCVQSSLMALLSPGPYPPLSGRQGLLQLLVTNATPELARHHVLVSLRKTCHKVNSWLK